MQATKGRVSAPYLPRVTPVLCKQDRCGFYGSTM